MAVLFEIIPEVPKKFLDTSKAKRAFDRALDVSAKEALMELKRTTATWRHQPVFTIKKLTYSRKITTTDRIFKWVDQGTPPHDISAKQGPYLRFRSGYTPKTVPRIIDSFQGGSYGPYRRIETVHHPGIKPRNFSETLTGILQEKLQDEVELALLQALGRIQF